jgi:hypothetical protein
MSKDQIATNFIGDIFTLTDNWLPVIPLPKGPIKYMEIGAYYGANICSIMKTYAAAAGSEVHCVDPWRDYDGYPEYKNYQGNIFTGFLTNMSRLSPADNQKLYIHRAFSGEALPTFRDEYFDIIYIDGNHEAPYVLEDAVLAYKKLAPGGWLIFDDFTWDGVRKGFDCFYTTYGPFLENPTVVPGLQCIVQKKVAAPLPPNRVV